MLLDSTKPVLIVDPVGDALPVLTSLLQRCGAGPVERADTGEAALAYLNDHTPSLIISEWTMAPMSGGELLRALRKDMKTAKLPLMIATASLRAEEALHAFELGADAVAIVPLLPRDFLRKIDAIPDRLPLSP